MSPSPRAAPPAAPPAAAAPLARPATLAEMIARAEEWREIMDVKVPERPGLAPLRASIARDLAAMDTILALLRQLQAAGLENVVRLAAQLGYASDTRQ